MPNEPNIARFPYPSPDRLTSCAARSDRVADLARTFPLAFFMLAIRHGPFEARREAIRLAELGRPLSEVAAAMGVPYCLRRLPPEVCRERLPAVAWSPNASRVLGDRIPKDPSASAAWLSAIYYVLSACDEEAAFWLSRQHVLFEGSRLPQSAYLPLALYAWASKQTDGHLRSLVYAPWHPRMPLDTAALEARNWLHRVKVQAYLGEEGLADPWVPGAHSGDFQIVPLLTASQILRESTAMANCLDSYAERLVSNRSRVFSIRLRDRRIANLEIEPLAKGATAGLPAYVITQLKGPHNGEAPEEVWRLAWDWLKVHGDRPPRRAVAPSRQILETRLRQAFAAYVDSRANRDLDWADMLTAGKLHASILALARRAGLPHSIMLFG